MSKRALAVAVLTAAGCAAMAASVLAAPPDRAAAIARALAFIGQNPASVHGGAGQAFVARDVVADADGSEHVRFDRTYRGLRVLGGDFVLHGDGHGAFSRVSAALRAPLNVSTRAVVNAAAAAEIAGQAFGADGLAKPAELVVDASDAPALAWEIVIRGTAADGTPREMHYLVDARSGTIRDSWDGIETSAANGTGQSFFNGTVALITDLNGSVFSLRDPSRGNQYTTDMNNGTSGNGTLFTDADNSWGNGALSSRQTVAVDAQYGTAETWDYYLNVHGRDGIADNGTGAFNRVHYSSGYNNAFWSDSCFCMTYGDGDGVTFNPFDSLDVAGHEMSHGVTSRTANLRYSGESGGLNEATSDIFGTMVEFYANNSSETPDYLIGERLYKSGGGKALRYMYRPTRRAAPPTAGAGTSSASTSTIPRAWPTISSSCWPRARASAPSPMAPGPPPATPAHLRASAALMPNGSVSRADRIHDVAHELFRCARGHAERGDRPLRHGQRGAERGRGRLERRQRELIARAIR